MHWLYKRGEVDRALLGGAKRHHAALARAAAQRLAVPASPGRAIAGIAWLGGPGRAADPMAAAPVRQGSARRRGAAS